MNTASEPYSTALLITKSMSYSRYFSTATATATNRHQLARSPATLATAKLEVNVTANVMIHSTAAAANHFSCSRSSPTDRANLTTTAAAPTASAASTQTTGANATAGPPIWPMEVGNGRAQWMVTGTSSATVASAHAPPTNHAPGR